MNDTVAITASGAIIEPVETAMLPMSSSIATTASAVGIGEMDSFSWGSVSRSNSCIVPRRWWPHGITSRYSRTTVTPMPPCHAVSLCVVCMSTCCYAAMLSCIISNCMYVCYSSSTVTSTEILEHRSRCFSGSRCRKRQSSRWTKGLTTQTTFDVEPVACYHVTAVVAAPRPERRCECFAAGARLHG